MHTVQAAIMGVFQGLTEFLPISSSGHIVLSSALFKLFTGANFELSEEEIFFDILIHAATLLAVFIYFYRDIKTIFCGFFAALYKRSFQDEYFKLGIYILLATFITCIVIFFIRGWAHCLTKNPLIVSLFLAITGVILFLSEKAKIKDKKIDYKTALLIGLAQGLAIMPGISRSGMTISAATICGVKRVVAARFSFILSIPIIIIASFVYPLMTFDFQSLKNTNSNPFIIGMLVSFAAGYVCIKYFMKFLEKNSLKCFAYYCIIIGGICAFIF